LGAIWGEDPRYVRAGAPAPFKSRIGHIVKWTVLAPNRDGELGPAYARFIAFSAGSFTSNAWREPSDTTMEHSLVRIPFGFLGRMASNAFDEFRPDAERKLFHRGPGEWCAVLWLEPSIGHRGHRMVQNGLVRESHTGEAALRRSPSGSLRSSFPGTLLPVARVTAIGMSVVEGHWPVLQWHCVGVGYWRTVNAN